MVQYSSRSLTCLSKTIKFWLYEMGKFVEYSIKCLLLKAEVRSKDLDCCIENSEK